MSESLCISPLSTQIASQCTKCNIVDRKNEDLPTTRVWNKIIVLKTIYNKENVIKRISENLVVS